MPICYADDFAIVSPNIEKTQRALIMIKMFCDLHNLSVDVSKTKALKFNAGATSARKMLSTYEVVTIENVNHFS